MSLFAEYAPGASGEASPAGLVIRPASASDAAALAAIRAEREGGDAVAHALAFQREIEAEDRGRLLLVAEVPAAGTTGSAAGEVAGFARVKHFSPPAVAPPNIAPAGYYLSGVIVARAWRRRGIARELTRRRLEWIAARGVEAFYFANARNRVSIDLHGAFGFEEVTRDFVFPGASFEGAVGILFRAILRG
jgi:ribosomal protein S18 acetylase RimI-like enzyme